MSTLYIVPTPIGNLEDITLRALRILGEASLIAAEDTRTTRVLLDHYAITTPMTSYHEHNKLAKLDSLLDALAGGDVALVSDAGMPGISDPGYELIREALARDVPVVVLPGPSAVVTALVVSGLPTDRFLFVGFLPRRKKALHAALAALASEPGTLVAYESPNRLAATLQAVLDVLGDRPVAVGRELSKLYEEVRRGPASVVLAHFAENPPRGEITLVIAGATDTPRDEPWDADRVRAALQARLSEIAEDTDGVSGRYLLTSYQHDAVENVASATQVFGLPAIKVGRKRGQTEESDGFERWRQERVDAVRAKLAAADELPASEALRRCRDLAVGYLHAPSRAEDVAGLLTAVREIAAPHVPPGVTDRLLELAQRLRSSAAPHGDADPDVEQAIKAVRGLRCSQAAFSDDGDSQARKALRRLQRLSVVTQEEEALLERAASWDIDVPPDFLPALAELQGALIDRLTPDERPNSAPMVSEDVEHALGSTIDALREAVRSSRGGVEAVLHEFLDDLDNDRSGTRDAVERYTVVLAATCQQAVGYQMSLLKGENNVFETVVVDEAARANPLDLFIPMALAERRIILVGDHRQLPHILDQEIESDLDSDVSAKTQEMLRTSLFERLFAQLRERERADGIKRTVTLDVQYRMHPVLGDFVSDTFYAPHGEGFSSGRPPGDFAHNLTRYDGAVAAWVDVPIGHGAERRGQSKSRGAEAKWIANEAHRLMTERPELSVGVISFYSAQVNEILRHMEPLGMTEQLEDGALRIHDSWRTTRSDSGKLTERLRVGTVDAFQGKEFDVVLLSMTRSNDIAADQPKLLRRKYGHLMLENRLCVAMSRQKRLLIVVGDSGMLTGEQAAEAVPGLVRFLKLCGGDHGVQLHA